MEKNRAFAECEREFTERRRRAEEIAEARERELIKNFPAFAALYKQERQAVLSAAREAAAGRGSKAKNELATLLKEKTEFLKSRALPSNYLLPAYACEKCSDTGTVGGEYCACFLKELRAKLFKDRAGDINVTFKNIDFKKVKDAAQRETLKKLYSFGEIFCAKFPDTEKRNILLLGKSGTGKTMLLNCMANELTERGFDVIYMTAFAVNAVFLECRTNFTEDKTPLLNALLTCDALIVDDFGAEPMYNNVTEEYFFAVLNERNLQNRSTLVSSNLDLSNIKTRYKDRIFSRLADKSKTHIFKLDGSDLRIK